MVELRPLATGRADTDAFELRGTDLAVLKREALRRCPQGAEVLRQAERGQTLTEPDGGRLSRWMQVASAWVDPPVRQAQLLVVCRADPLRMALAVPAPSMARVSPEVTAIPPPRPSPQPYGEGPPAEALVPVQPNLPAPPIGPIDPTW